MNGTQQHIIDQQNKILAWIQTSDGVVMELDNGENLLVSVSNLGGSEIDNLVSQGVNQHGTTWDDYRFRPRVTTIELRRLACGCYGVCADLITESEPVVCPRVEKTFYCNVPAADTDFGTFDCGIFIPPQPTLEPIRCISEEEIVTCLCATPDIIMCDGEPLICDGEPLVCGITYTEEPVMCTVVKGMEQTKCCSAFPQLYNGMYLTDHLRPNRGTHYLYFSVGNTLYRIPFRIDAMPTFGIGQQNGSALQTQFRIYSPSPFFENGDETCLQWSFGECVTCPTTGELIYCGDGCDPLVCVPDGLVNQELELRYCGTWRTNPNFKIQGPIDNPVIQNTITGRSIELNYCIADGETVWINLENTADNRYTKTVISSINGDISGVVVDDTEFSTFALEPHPQVSYGNNRIKLTGEGATAETFIEMCFREKYIGLGA